MFGNSHVAIMTFWVILLIFQWTLYVEAIGEDVTGTTAEVKYFSRNYMPTGLPYGVKTSRSLLSCACDCHQQNCSNLVYDEQSRDCVINEDFLSFPPGTTFQSGSADRITFVEFEQDSWDISATPVVSCSADADCLDGFSVDSVCEGGTCACKPCHKFIGTACAVAVCTDFGTDFTEYPTYVIYQNSLIVLPGRTLAQCQEDCVNESSFTCRSVDFRASDGSCQLTNASMCTLPDSFLSGFSGWNHYHRHCQAYD